MGDLVRKSPHNRPIVSRWSGAVPRNAMQLRQGRQGTRFRLRRQIAVSQPATTSLPAPDSGSSKYRERWSPSAEAEAGPLSTALVSCLRWPADSEGRLCSHRSGVGAHCSTRRAGSIEIDTVTWPGRVQSARHGGDQARARGFRTSPAFDCCEVPIRRSAHWLNIAENQLNSLTRQCVSGRRFADLATLSEEIDAWSTDSNTTQPGVDSQMTISDAWTKLKAVYPTIKLRRSTRTGR